jgi:protein gp37
VARYQVAEIRRWITPQRVLVGPRLLFINENSDETIRDVFIVMARSSMHTFKVLTKNTERMQQWFGGWAAHEAEEILDMQQIRWPPPNVHLGIRVNRQQSLDEHASDLLDSPATSRFILIDPLFGDIDLTSAECSRNGEVNVLVEGVDQVILGCDALNEPIGWARRIVEQCLDHGVSFHQIRGST